MSVPILTDEVRVPPKPLTILLLSRKGPTKSVDMWEKQPDARLSIPIVQESVSNGVIRWARRVDAYTATDWHMILRLFGLPFRLFFRLGLYE